MKKFLIASIMFFGYSYIVANVENYTYKMFYGERMLAPEIASITNPRVLKIFNAYPFLYDIDLQIAQEINEAWAARKDSILIVAYDNKEPIGYIRGMSFDSVYPMIVKACADAGLEVEKFYYISDVFVDESYRHQGLAKHFFKKIESSADSLGYVYGVLDSESHDDDPLKPVGFKELDFSKIGYELSADTVCEVEKEVEDEHGEISIAKSLHRVDFWVKDLRNH